MAPLSDITGTPGTGSKKFSFYAHQMNKKKRMRPPPAFFHAAASASNKKQERIKTRRQTKQENE
jgi:hypothetical protein